LGQLDLSFQPEGLDTLSPWVDLIAGAFFVFKGPLPT